MDTLIDRLRARLVLVTHYPQPEADDARPLVCTAHPRPTAWPCPQGRYALACRRDA